MDELRGGPDEPDYGDRPERQASAAGGGDYGAVREALADLGRLPGDELFKAVDYGDGSDESFLRRLWHDLYGDEPITDS